MEVLKIDWKNVESRFEKDEVYEQINAPKWMDLMAPDVAIDDVAFFCKPDCNHPKSIADFGSSPWLSKIGRFNSEVPLSPLRDQLRRRTELRNKVGGVRTGGLLSSSVSSLSDLKSSPSLATKSKGVKKPLVSRSINFGGSNAENKDPNCRPLLLNSKSNSNSLGALKRSATFTGGEERAMNTKPTRCLHYNTSSNSNNDVTKKHQHKSSSPAATPPGSERKDKEKGRQHPVLRSASSARNLFAGKDILNQISEFCTELKKLAFNAPNSSNYTHISGTDSGMSTTMKSSRKASKSPVCLPVRNHVSGSTPPPDGKKQRSFDLTGKTTLMKCPRQNSCNKSRSNGEEEEEMVNGKLQRRPEWKVSGKASSVVRSTPPTPQKISPAVAKIPPKPKPNHKLIVNNNKNNNRNENRTTKSTMEEELGGGAIQKLNPDEEEEGVEEDASDMELCSPMKEEEEKQALDMFWFFKPCALSLYTNK